MDSLTKNILIKTQSKADFNTFDVCESDSAVFTNKSQDANSTLWKFGDGVKSNQENPKHKYKISFSTTFSVTLVALVNDGCSDSITKAIRVNQNPNSDFSYIYSGTKVDLKITKAGNNYQWKFGTTDSIKTTTTTYTHTIKSFDQNTICLIVTDISACTSKTCKNVSVGITNLNKPSGFKIYPNPNRGNFTIEIENPSNNVSIEVFDMLGKMVKKVDIMDSRAVNIIDMEGAEGVYLVKVKNGESVWNKKVVLAHE